MSASQIARALIGGITVTGLCLVVRLAAQQPDSKKSTKPADNAAAGESADAAEKAKIMASPAWAQVSEGFQKWLASQAIYTPADINRINANLAAQIRTMPASELQGFIDDWQARLKVLNGKDFQDAQQWLGEFLSVLADGYRRQTLKNLGLADVTNMSAAQLEDAITRIEADRLRRQQSQVAFDQQRQQTVQTVQARNAAMQQTLDQQRSTRPAQFGTNQSPYRPPRWDPPPRPRQQFMLDSNGRLIFFLPN
jgi:hypothetical protein